jgi:peptide/nickel transport system substrate-binding protein
MAVSQADYMMAATGDPRWWQTCFSYFVCGSPNGTEVGSDAYRHPDLARAKQLLAESGYKGEKVVMLSSHELDYIGALNDVAVANLKALGVNLDVIETDWGTLVARRANKNPPDHGGWNLFITSLSGSAQFSPLSNPVTDESCDQKNWFGWPCDEKAEKLRTAYIEATDPEKQKAALEALHTQLWQDIPTVLIGQYTQLYAWRKNLIGLPRSPSAVLAFWNVEKK